MYTKTEHREAGNRGLYKGMNSKLVQSILGSAVLFSSKEILFDWIVAAIGSGKLH
jgi:hypothetical protein